MIQNTFIKQRNKKYSEKIISNLIKRHFDAYYTETKQEALEKAISLINKDDIVSWGGSTSITEIGLIDYLINNNYKLINRDNASTPEEKTELLKKALLCDTYLMGTNAISEDGQLVNIDCMGNRIAALMFGPKNVIIIAGINKVSSSLDNALKRARETAAPINMQRISATKERKTPCFYTGTCQDCLSTDSICSNIVITRLCNPQKRIKIILVNEQLGF